MVQDGGDAVEQLGAFLGREGFVEGAAGRDATDREIVEGSGFDAARFVEFLGFDLACAIEAAGGDEGDDLAHFVAIEPDAVVSADIDDDARSAGIVHPAHEVLALRALEITDVGINGGRMRDDQTRGSLAGLGVGADMLEAADIDPQAAAAGAFFQRGAGDFNAMERQIASWAGMRGICAMFDGDRAGPAVGAKLGADKHHAQAFGAGDSLQGRVAVSALSIGRRGGCAALGAEEGASFHNLSL